MFLGLVVLEEKLFPRMSTCTPTPQSDDIKNTKDPDFPHLLIIKAATGWSVLANGVDFGRSQVFSGPLKSCKLLQ